jgi:tetratricopeptide (TPR) repeat protein
MLTALKPTDDNGQPVNRECIYEQCRFFNLEARDCGLMMASRAMLRMADENAARATMSLDPVSALAAAVEATTELDRRMTAVGKDLLQSSLEVQGVVHEAGQALLEKVAASEAAAAGRHDALARRLSETQPAAGVDLEPLLARLDQRFGALDQRLAELTRPLGTLDERLGGLGKHLGGLEERLRGLEEAGGRTLQPLRTLIEEGLAKLALRLDEQGRRAGDLGPAVTLLTTQITGLIDLQQKVADRLLEENSLLVASVQKFEQTLGGLDKKIDRTAEDSLQISQLITLVKGQTEKTHAALRTINEGNRSVIQAIETQLQRDQADLARRRKDEALECNNRGVALYYRGALEAAADAFKRAVELEPEYAEAHNNLGLALSRLGREPEAVEAFQKALTLDPRMGEAYNNLGFLYHTSAQFDRAAEMFGQAIENAADSSIAYTNLGNCLYKMKQPEKAVEAWRRAIELDPMNENARRGLRMFQQDAVNN